MVSLRKGKVGQEEVGWAKRWVDEDGEESGGQKKRSGEERRT